MKSIMRTKMEETIIAPDELDRIAEDSCKHEWIWGEEPDVVEYCKHCGTLK